VIYLETSAVNSHNIEEAIDNLAELCIQQHSSFNLHFTKKSQPEEPNPLPISQEPPQTGGCC
jgi:hypothetical protein